MDAISGDGDHRQEHERPGKRDDRELVARLVAGERQALADAFGAYAPLVFAVSCRVLHDQALAEDVTQEVFVFLWQHPDRFNPSLGSLRSWLGMVAHRRAVDRVRAETRRTRTEARAEPATMIATEADDYLTATWLSARVRAALGQLPVEQRQVVMLAYYGDRTYRQVADELALPEGTVKSRIRLALKRLDTLLRAEFNDQDEPAWT
jgi:RNA polymerase sigma factor (sigma-70 family)